MYLVLERYLTFLDDDEFVGGVRGVLPALARRVGPQIAAEAAEAGHAIDRLIRLY